MTEFNNSIPTENPAEVITAIEAPVAEPVAESEVIPADDIAEVEDIADAEDIVEAEDAIEIDDIVEAEDVAKTEDIIEADDVAEGDDIVEAEDTAEAEDIVETECTAEVEEVVEADDAAEVAPVICPDDLTDLEFDEYFASISIPDFDEVPDDDERYISNSMRMRTFLQEKQPSESAPAPSVPVKKTLANKIDNFFYHNKALCILIAIAAVLAAVWGIISNFSQL